MAEPGPDKMAVTVDSNSTNQTVRDSVFEEMEHNAHSTCHASASDNLPKKKSTFKITSVTKNTPRDVSRRNGSGEPLTDGDHDADVDSTDDLEESRTEDFSSEILDSSKTTDFDQDATEDTMQNLTPEVEMIKDVKEKSDYSRFKVVKIETKNPIRRGRWTCQDFLDAVRERSDTKIVEETRSGNSSAGSSIHYVHGVDDPSKNPLTAGSSSGGVPPSQIVETLVQTVVPEGFQPIHPVSNANQQTPFVGIPPGNYGSPHFSSTTPLPDQASPATGFQTQNMHHQGHLPEHDKSQPQQQNLSQVQQSLQPAPGQNILQVTASGQVNQPQQMMTNIAPVSSQSQSSPVQPSSVPTSVAGNTQVIDTIQGTVSSFPHTPQQSTLGHDTQGNVVNNQTSGGIPTHLPVGMTDAPSVPGQKVSMYQPVIQTTSVPSDANALQLSNVSSVMPSGTHSEVVSNTNLVDVVAGSAVSSDKSMQEEVRNVVQQNRDFIQISDFATTPLLTQVVEAVGGISSPTKENPDDGGSNSVAIDNKIEQAMDLVKSHLMYAVREEVEVLKEQIKELMEKNSQLEYENSILRAAAGPETLAKLSQPRPQPPPSSS